MTVHVRTATGAERSTFAISSPRVPRLGQSQRHPYTQHSGTVLGARLRFVFVGDSETEEGWTYPDLIDYISETEKFGVTGIAEGTPNGSEIRATMDGDLVYWDLVYWVAPTSNATWWCRTKDHTVTLRR